MSNLMSPGDNNWGQTPLFTPLWPLRSGWAQTIGATLVPQPRFKNVDCHYELPLPDGDRLILCENRPAAWKVGARVVVLVHGLTGSAFSKDTSRLGVMLYRAGYCVVRVNLRNCGPGFGLARKIYHSGRSEDTRAVQEFVAKLHLGSPVTQIGFSLGGNITLKMAGEDGERPTGALDSVVAVSPPADLAASARKLSLPSNRFFDTYFVSRLKRDIARLSARDPSIFAPKFPKKLSLTNFDDLYTAPCGGFEDASDYYRRASSLPFVTSIRAETLIIGSEDDPVVDMLPLKEVELGPHQKLMITEHGGHCGFLGYGEGHPSWHWADHVILKWISKLQPKS